MKKLTPFKKRFDKKAQTEMLGLVIIVILIVIGALFYVRFAIFGKSGELQQKENSIMITQAYNMMNALSNIKVCNNVSIAEGFYICNHGGELCGEDACNYLDTQIDSIVKSTLYRDYSLNVSGSGLDYRLPKADSCKYGVSSYPYVFDVKGETYKAFFKICQTQTSPKTTRNKT